MSIVNSVCMYVVNSIYTRSVKGTDRVSHHAQDEAQSYGDPVGWATFLSILLIPVIRIFRGIDSRYMFSWCFGRHAKEIVSGLRMPGSCISLLLT